jgi:hypothetical protein
MKKTDIYNPGHKSYPILSSDPLTEVNGKLEGSIHEIACRWF